MIFVKSLFLLGLFDYVYGTLDFGGAPGISTIL
jgi:hypothetical protein